MGGDAIETLTGGNDKIKPILAFESRNIKMILIYKKYLAVTEMPKMLIKLGLLVKGSRSALTNIYS